MHASILHVLSVCLTRVIASSTKVVINALEIHQNFPKFLGLAELSSYEFSIIPDEAKCQSMMYPERQCQQNVRIVQSLKKLRI